MNTKPLLLIFCAMLFCSHCGVKEEIDQAKAQYKSRYESLPDTMTAIISNRALNTCTFEDYIDVKYPGYSVYNRKEIYGIVDGHIKLINTIEGKYTPRRFVDEQIIFE